MTYVYDPDPTRVWSRVENRCPSLYGSTEAERMQYKGNILQHKGNSSQLTKSQVYSLINRGKWVSRRTSWATQTQTYTNPNTAYLERVNFVTYPLDNTIVGAPNNPAGPFAIVRDPNGCDLLNAVTDGGNLVCGTLANPCTNEVLIPNNSREPICVSTTASDVPGPPMELCWNSTYPTYFPKQRYIMNTSNTGWPKNYKGFRSAMFPVPPLLEYNTQQKALQWRYVTSACVPVTNFGVFANGVLVARLPVTVTSYAYTKGATAVTFTVVSYSTDIASEPSNAVAV